MCVSHIDLFTADSRCATLTSSRFITSLKNAAGGGVFAFGCKQTDGWNKFTVFSKCLSCGRGRCVRVCVILEQILQKKKSAGLRQSGGPSNTDKLSGR